MTESKESEESKDPWVDPEFWTLIRQFDNSHEEPSDCSDYRFDVLERITRRRKDEILYEIGRHLKNENAELEKQNRKPYTEAERMLIAYSLGRMRGFKRGKYHAEFMARFRKFYDLSEEDPIPSGQEFFLMCRKMDGR